MERCTDGNWNGKQYFKCPPGRALFCPLRSLEQDTRYMEPHQVPAARRQELKNRKYLYFNYTPCIMYTHNYIVTYYIIIINILYM